MVLPSLRQGVRLLYPDPQDVPQTPRIAAGHNQIILIRHPGKACGRKAAPIAHKLPDLFVQAGLYHIEHGRNHQPVFRKPVLRPDHIHADIFLIKRLIVEKKLLQIIQVLTGARAAVNGPPVVPVKIQGRVRLCPGPQRPASQAL